MLGAGHLAVGPGLGQRVEAAVLGPLRARPVLAHRHARHQSVIGAEYIGSDCVNKTLYYTILYSRWIESAKVRLCVWLLPLHLSHVWALLPRRAAGPGAARCSARLRGARHKLGTISISPESRQNVTQFSVR